MVAARNLRTVVCIGLAPLAFKTEITQTSERIVAIDTQCAIQTRIWRTLVFGNFTVVARIPWQTQTCVIVAEIHAQAAVSAWIAEAFVGLIQAGRTGKSNSARAGESTRKVDTRAPIFTGRVKALVGILRTIVTFKTTRTVTDEETQLISAKTTIFTWIQHGEAVVGIYLAYVTVPA
jgi:hypothetical protein